MLPQCYEEHPGPLINLTSSSKGSKVLDREAVQLHDEPPEFLEQQVEIQMSYFLFSVWKNKNDR